MESLDKLLNNVAWDKEPAEQIETLKQFDNLSKEQINYLVSPHFVKSQEAGIAIKYIGLTKLTNNVDELLIFLQDMNWPAAGHVSDLLTSMGRIIFPSVKKVFREGNDGLWNYWILLGVIRNFDNENIELLKPDLLALIRIADKDGACIEALKILKRILNDNEYSEQFNYLLDRFQGEDYWLADLHDDS